MTTFSQDNVVEIPVTKIREGELGIRKFYDEEALNDLGKSLSKRGFIYPIFVTKLPESEYPQGEYELIIGSRRLRAARKLKLKCIPAFIVPSIGGEDKLLIMLTENLHREDLTPFEEAWAILKLINEHKMSLKQVAETIEKDEQFVRRRIQLLSLPKEVQKLVAGKHIGLAHLTTLANLGSPDAQVQFARIAVKNQLNEEELATLVRQELALPPKSRSKNQLKLNWKKVGLQIVGFASWLENAVPKGCKISPKEARTLRSDLHRLKKAVTQAIRNAQTTAR